VAHRAAKLHAVDSHGDYELEGLMGGKQIICQLHLAFLYREVAYPRICHATCTTQAIEVPIACLSGSVRHC
jgi:hypothetical protein